MPGPGCHEINKCLGTYFEDIQYTYVHTYIPILRIYSTHTYIHTYLFEDIQYTYVSIVRCSRHERVGALYSVVSGLLAVISRACPRFEKSRVCSADDASN